MHGGSSPGAPSGDANGNYRHGGFTKQREAEVRAVASLVRGCRDALKRVGNLALIGALLCGSPALMPSANADTAGDVYM